MQPMNGTVVKAEEKISKVEEYGEYEATRLVTFALEMTRDDYLRFHRARQDKEELAVTVLLEEA